jgi:hypothetical protein
MSGGTLCQVLVLLGVLTVRVADRGRARRTITGQRRYHRETFRISNSKTGR